MESIILYIVNKQISATPKVMIGCIFTVTSCYSLVVLCLFSVIVFHSFSVLGKWIEPTAFTRTTRINSRCTQPGFLVAHSHPMRMHCMIELTTLLEMHTSFNLRSFAHTSHLSACEPFSVNTHVWTTHFTFHLTCEFHARSSSLTPLKKFVLAFDIDGCLAVPSSVEAGWNTFLGATVWPQLTSLELSSAVCNPNTTQLQKASLGDILGSGLDQ